MEHPARRGGCEPPGGVLRERHQGQRGLPDATRGQWRVAAPAVWADRPAGGVGGDALPQPPHQETSAGRLYVWKSVIELLGRPINKTARQRLPRRRAVC